MEYDGKFVTLLRHGRKPAGNTWGLPGGKVESGETDTAAMLRELQEETGHRADPLKLEHIGTYPFVDHNDEPFQYCTYKITLQALPDIRLETNAHTEYAWVTPQECLALANPIPGLHELLGLVGYLP